MANLTNEQKSKLINLEGLSTFYDELKEDYLFSSEEKTQIGNLTSGNGHANKVWKTDASGNPAWRDDESGTAILSYTTAEYNAIKNSIADGTQFIITDDYQEGSSSSGTTGSIFHIVAEAENFSGCNVTVTLTDSILGNTEEVSGTFDEEGICNLNVSNIGTYEIIATDKEGENYTSSITLVCFTVKTVTIYTFSEASWIQERFPNISNIDDLTEKQVRELLTVHSSVDSLVKGLSNNSDLATQILSNDLIAKWINLRDYALDKLYEVESIKSVMDEIGLYGYGELDYASKVPIMTSATAPYGEAFHSSTFTSGSYDGWKAFQSDVNDESVKSGWISTATDTNPYAGYMFQSAIVINKAYVRLTVDNTAASFPYSEPLTFDIEGSNTSKTEGYVKLNDTSFSASAYGLYECSFNNNTSYKYYRIKFSKPTMVTQGKKYTTTRISFCKFEPIGCVPIMTSNTAPYGEAVCSIYSSYGANAAWQAFNPESRSMVFGSPSSLPANTYYGYKFVVPTCVRKLYFKNTQTHSSGSFSSYEVWASNDNFITHDVLTDTLLKSTTLGDETFVEIDNDNYYIEYRIANITQQVGQSSGYFGPVYTQFYGRQMKSFILPMTSNNSPKGTAKSGPYTPADDTVEAYRAFNNNTSDRFYAHTSASQWLSYGFEKPMKVKAAGLTPYSFTSGSTRYTCVKSFSIQVSENNSTWQDIYVGITENKNYVGMPLMINLDLDKEYQYYKLTINEAWNGYHIAVTELQYYGFDYSECEFEENTKVNFIYDHGVEVQKLTKTSTSVLTNIDTTSSSLLRASEGLYATTSDTIKCGSASATMTTIMLPSNGYLDISSVNGTNTTGFSSVTNTSDIACWIE